LFSFEGPDDDHLRPHQRIARSACSNIDRGEREQLAAELAAAEAKLAEEEAASMR
jgi:hypothetical protein